MRRLPELAATIALFACAPSASPTPAPKETSPPERRATADVMPPRSPAPTEVPVEAEPAIESAPPEPPTEPAPPPPADPPATEPDPLDAAPIASRWSIDEDDRESFGYVCVWYGGGKPRCIPSRLETVAAWTLKTARHRDARNPNRIILHRRRGPVVPVRGAPLPAAEPIPSSDLTIRELVSDGVHFWFIELDGWLLEATSCGRHADRVRADMIEWAKRASAEI